MADETQTPEEPKLAPRFNPKRDHGTVFGMPGVQFEQNGCLYNAGHQAVNEFGKPIPMEPEKQFAPQPVKELESQAEQDADDDTPNDEKAVDLEGWIAGTQPYRFGVIVAFLQEKTGERAKSKDEAMALANRYLAGEFAGLNKDA